MFLDIHPNQTKNHRASTSTSSNLTNSGTFLNQPTLSSLAAVSSSPLPPSPAAPVSGSSNVTDIDSVITKVTAFRRFKSKLVKKKEKTGSVQGKGKPKEVVPDSATGCSNDVAESSSKKRSAAEKLIVVDTIEDDKPSPNQTYNNDVEHEEQSGSGSASESDAVVDSRTESTTNLAHRIQTLLSSSCSPSQFFPFSLTNVNPANSTTDESTTTVQKEEITSLSHQQPDNHDSRFKLIPDSLFKLHLTDTKFMNFLTTSPYSIMSGTKNNNGSSDSLHDVLDKWTRFVIRKHPRTIETESHENDMIGDDSDSDSSSVVLSCPLQPTSETEVEIARSEVVSVEFDAEPSIESKTQQQQPFLLPPSDSNSFWSFRQPSQTADLNIPSPSKSSRLKEIRIWYPSRTKVSLEATWWGYRIYLPPPVMQILSDKSLEAAKRAAMITAALTWLISRIPLEVLPPQFKPLTLILKEIVPLVGYVGGFIAWSWNTVKGFDKGDGVILSATWLLPIALIPGTWFYTEPSSDIPLEVFSDGRITTSDRPNSSPPPPPPKDAPSVASKSVSTSSSGLTQAGSRRPGPSLRKLERSDP
ncbi:hypothetical protein Clacol_007765 [Clathrus columnatus]|uniref:Uncharacterized protein n=1 Tax=Clathrus columnatus TaxID=1419009 RepID=A0AAV5AKP4_9AGAM|nr:hypothetical protein Clacol_007765 [Clathrus columnatus]